MSRNMIKTNSDFFSNILSRLDDDLAKRVPNTVRYIATTEDEKIWLKSLRIKYSFRISRDTFALLVYLEREDYLCLVNIGTVDGKLPPCMTDVPVNAGLITVLGSEGYLTPKFDHVRQSQIYENVMYDTSEVVGYQGHQWTEIMDLFPSVYCYKLNLEEDDVDIRENLNLFYKLLCQIALDCDMENNPYTENLKSVWEKIFYEGTLAKIQYKNLLMAYISLTWDISYLYLYQCLEDKFASEAVKSLHSRLGIGISELDLSNLLYDELSWQPKDMEGIESIINKHPNTRGVKLLQTLAHKENLSKFIYSIRNSIVHETRSARIPLEDDTKWESIIEGILYLLMDT